MNVSQFFSCVDCGRYIIIAILCSTLSSVSSLKHVLYMVLVLKVMCNDFVGMCFLLEIDSNCVNKSIRVCSECLHDVTVCRQCRRFSGCLYDVTVGCNLKCLYDVIV